jgi:hypothetical protein
MRTDFNIKTIARAELWKLALLTIAELRAAEASEAGTSFARTRALKRLEAILLELKLRGDQLAIDRLGDKQVSRGNDPH